MSWLVHDLEHGGGLVDANGVRTLMVSEESEQLWRTRRDDMGLGSATEVISRPFKTRASKAEWQAFISHLAPLVRERGYKLVILDSLPNLWPVADENNAAEVLEALNPLYELLDCGVALLLVHHPKKGDATEGQAMRGSGALPAWVDVILDFRRSKQNDLSCRQRTIKGSSRFDETPVEAVFELGDEGYKHLGDRAHASRAERFRVIEGILRSANTGLSPKQVLEKWTSGPMPGKSTIRKDLNAGAESGLWQCSGQGVRGDEHRFHIPVGIVSSQVPPLRGGNESNGTDAPQGEVA